MDFAYFFNLIWPLAAFGQVCDVSLPISSQNVFPVINNFASGQIRRLGTCPCGQDCPHWSGQVPTVPAAPVRTGADRCRQSQPHQSGLVQRRRICPEAKLLIIGKTFGGTGTPFPKVTINPMKLLKMDQNHLNIPHNYPNQ